MVTVVEFQNSGKYLQFWTSCDTFCWVLLFIRTQCINFPCNRVAVCMSTNYLCTIKRIYIMSFTITRHCDHSTMKLCGPHVPYQSPSFWCFYLNSFLRSLWSLHSWKGNNIMNNTPSSLTYTEHTHTHTHMYIPRVWFTHFFRAGPQTCGFV